jgi:hypothetical protein
MAEILVTAGRGNTPAREGAYIDDEPVAVMEDGHDWSHIERGPRFKIIKRPGVPTNILKFLEDDHGVPARSRKKWRLSATGRVFDRETGTERPV